VLAVRTPVESRKFLESLRLGARRVADSFRKVRDSAALQSQAYRDIAGEASVFRVLMEKYSSGKAPNTNVA
jgi:hypothetical protein